MDEKLPPRCIEPWNRMLRKDLAEMGRLTMSERFQMLDALFELGRLVPEHPAHTRWREREKQKVRERWNRIKDILGQHENSGAREGPKARQTLARGARPATCPS